MRWCPLRGWGGESLSWEETIAVGKRVYGSPATVDPESGYQDKAIPAVWHAHRSVLKDSAPVDDQTFPRVFSLATEDRLARADGMEGPQFEHHLLLAATGAWESPEEIDQACERVFNLERAIHMRSHQRSRQDDETVIPAFERPEIRPNPVLGQRHALERDKFLPLMDQYYRLQGWDPETGWPTAEKLAELGLEDVAQELAGLKLLPE
jgi:aldehyde:ferredoxin oxidoreductase